MIQFNHKRAKSRKGNENMALTERQNGILSLLKEKKSERVSKLAGTLYVSEATIRRDLAEMEQMGLIERSHGGAILPASSDEISIFFRMEKNPREKEKVATKALTKIPFFKTVFVDSSSTALALTERMDLSHKTVVTNNLQAALTLTKKPNVNLVLLGGSVQFNTNSTTGSWTTRQLDDFSFDLAIASCAAVMNGGAFERSIDGKELKQAAFLKSEKKILLIDHTKFSLRGTYRTTMLSDYDLVVTDEIPSGVYIPEGTNII